MSYRYHMPVATHPSANVRLTVDIALKPCLTAGYLEINPGNRGGPKTIPGVNYLCLAVRIKKVILGL